MVNRHIAIALMLFTCICTSPQKVTAQEPVSFQVFYDQLSPYGTWIDDPDYGYVWLPNVERGFTPYATNGYWVFTDLGWAWVSDYPWGWAPFHYGRWYTDAFYGPMWVPDNEWSPAWVNWRRSKSYYGWEPMRPSHGHGHDEHNDHWTFVRNRDFGKKDIHNYYVNSSRNTAIMPYTTSIDNARQDKEHNVTYNSGPNRADVETRSGRSVAPMNIRERNTPGQELGGDQIQMYRPQVQRSGANGPKPAPATIANKRDLKRIDGGQTQPANRPAAKQVKPAQPRQQAPPTQRSGGVKQPQQTNQPARQPRSKPAPQPTPQPKQTEPRQKTRSGGQQTSPPARNSNPPRKQSPAPKQDRKSGGKQMPH